MSRIAIVMPVYNSAKFLSKTIQAIINQEFRNWKLYCVDDGSTDDSVNIIAGFGDVRIEILKSDRFGPAGARNKALEEINKGDFDFIAYCDSDDVWNLNHLSTSLSYLKNADMVYSDVDFKFDDGTPAVTYGIPYYVSFQRENLFNGNFIYISTVVHKANAWEYFRKDAVPMEDWDMWLKISKNHSVVHNTNKTATYTYKKEGSYYSQEDSLKAKQKIMEFHNIKDEISKASKIEGWLSEVEGKALYDYAKDGICLEIGSYKGKSTNYIARNAQKVYCVDPFKADWTGQNQNQDYTTLLQFLDNTKEFKNVYPILSKSQDVVASFADEYFDLIFIDGLHDYESCKRDLLMSWPKLKKGGVLCFHDYQKDWPGVIQVVNEFFGGPDKQFDSIAAVTKIKTIIEHQKSEEKKTIRKKVLICPYSHKMLNGQENPKNFPYFGELVERLKAMGCWTVQLGVSGEKFIGADEVVLNANPDRLKQLLLESDTFITVDSFFQHFAQHNDKHGIVIFSQSDPEIFGYAENTNLLKSRQYLRRNQFGKWDEAKFDVEAFVSAEEVAAKTKRLLEI